MASDHNPRGHSPAVEHHASNVSVEGSTPSARSNDQDLAGLPELVADALRRTDVTVEMFDTLVTVNRDDYDTIRAELLRLARENADLHTTVTSMQEDMSAMLALTDRVRAERDEAQAELATARETIKRLNRRVQVAEAGIAEKVKEASGRNLGRALANAAAEMFMHERDEALAELAALKRRIAEAVELRVGDPAWSDGTLAEMGGQRVALLPVGGE